MVWREGRLVQVGRRCHRGSCTWIPHGSAADEPIRRFEVAGLAAPVYVGTRSTSQCPLLRGNDVHYTNTIWYVVCGLVDHQVSFLCT